ncbi:MAG TPA: DUF2380 domain-containing protein [Gemmatimonadales bacterium]|nr:DUF2380 domain-containing protein [Gemmatimonadales bacterium]
MIRSTAVLLGLLASPALASAQGVAVSPARPPLAAPDAKVALLPTALYNEQANVLEASDTVAATTATATMNDRLRDRLGAQAVVVPADAACRVTVACAREAARRSGAAWVVMLKVSKTSNLIWLLTGQLIHVPTGEIVLDDSTELKGEPVAMTRIGTRSFADRVARTVKAGGATNDYPNGVPDYVGPSGQ